MIFEKELKQFGILFGTFLLIAIFINSFSTAIASNYILGFSIFLLVYSMFIQYAVFKRTPLGEPIEYIKITFAWLLIFLALDLVLYPILATPDGGIAENLPINAMLSTDVFIWRMFPDSLPNIIHFGIVYVLVPSIFIFLATLIVPRKQSSKFIESNL